MHSVTHSQSHARAKSQTRHDNLERSYILSRTSFARGAQSSGARLKRKDGTYRVIPKRVKRIPEIQADRYVLKLQDFGIKMEDGEVPICAYDQMKGRSGNENADSLLLTTFRIIQIANSKVEEQMHLATVTDVTVESTNGWDVLYVTDKHDDIREFSVSSSKIGSFFRSVLKEEIAGHTSSSSVSADRRKNSYGGSAIQRKHRDESALVRVVILEREANGDLEGSMPSLSDIAQDFSKMAAVHIDMKKPFKGHTAMHISENKIMFKKYPRTFEGNCAMEWVITYCERLKINADQSNAVDSESAKRFLQSMMSRGFFRKANSKARNALGFETLSKHLYRFKEDEDESTSPAIILNQGKEGSALQLKEQTCPCDLAASMLLGALHSMATKQVVAKQNWLISQANRGKLLKSMQEHFERAQLLYCIKDEDLYGLSDNQRTCFFFNVYNLLVIHASCTVLNSKRPVLNDEMRQRVAYRIGSFVFSLYDLEYICLRGDSSIKKGMNKHFGMAESEDKREKIAGNNWDPLMNFCLSNATRSCPRIFVFVAHDSIRDVIMDCARDFIYRNVKFGFVPQEDNERKMQYYIIYAPKILKKAEFGGGDIDVLVSWLIPFCPLSVQLQIQQHQKDYTGPPRVQFYDEDLTFGIDLQHIGAGDLSFIDASTRVIVSNDSTEPAIKKDPKVPYLWSLLHQLSEEVGWLDEIRTLSSLREIMNGVLGSKPVRNPLGKMVQVYVKSVLKEWNTSHESGLHPLFAPMLKILANVHYLIVRYSKYMKQDGTNRTTEASLNVAGPCMQKVLQEVSWKIVEQKGEHDEELTQEGVLEELEHAIMGKAYPVIMAWYMDKHLDTDIKVTLARDELYNDLTLQMLEVDDFFRLQEDLLLEKYEANPPLPVLTPMFLSLSNMSYKLHSRDKETQHLSFSVHNQSAGKPSMSMFSSVKRDTYTVSSTTNSPPTTFQNFMKERKSGLQTYDELQPYKEALEMLNAMDTRDPRPGRNLLTLASIVDAISGANTKYWEDVISKREQAAKEGNGEEGQTAPRKRRNLSADDLILIFTYLVFKADRNQTHLVAFVNYLSDFIEATQNHMPPTLSSVSRYYEDIYFGQGGFSLTTVLSALLYAPKLPTKFKSHIESSRTRTPTQSPKEESKEGSFEDEPVPKTVGVLLQPSVTSSDNEKGQPPALPPALPKGKPDLGAAPALPRGSAEAPPVPAKPSEPPALPETLPRLTVFDGLVKGSDAPPLPDTMPKYSACDDR